MSKKIKEIMKNFQDIYKNVIYKMRRLLVSIFKIIQRS